MATAANRGGRSVARVLGRGARVLVFAAIGIGLAACGTIATRREVLVGGYPFEAVVVDVMDVAEPKRDGSATGVPKDDGLHSIRFFATLPVDLAIDLVLSPVDLIAWAFGSHKTLGC